MTQQASECPRFKLTVPTVRRQRPPPVLQALPFSPANSLSSQVSRHRKQNNRKEKYLMILTNQENVD
jgi:hypothetical protein